MLEGTTPTPVALLRERVRPSTATLEDEYAQDERWEDLAGILIERAEAAEDVALRTATLARVAQIFETNLGDDDKALLILQTAWSEDFTDDAIAREIERLAARTGRLAAVVEEYEAVAVEAPHDARRVALLLRLADWQEQHLGFESEAESKLVAALAQDPASVAAACALSDFFGRRGDWERAELHLVRASSAAAEPADRLHLSLAAAEIAETRLADREQAAELYARALEIDSGHVGAATALADITTAQGDFKRALPVLEHLLSIAAQTPSERTRLLCRIAEAAEKVGDVTRARECLLEASRADASDLETLRRWVALAVAQQWRDDVRSVGETLLARADAGLSTEERADLAARVGEAHLAEGDPAQAAAALGQAVAAAPEDRASREQLAAALARAGDGPGALEQERALLEGLSSAEHRFACLQRIVALCRDVIGDQRAALEACGEALALRPDDHGTMHAMLDLLTAAKQWKRAVEVLKMLAASETKETRAKFLVAAANILHYELHASDEAIEIYNQVLDENPDDLKTFERIDKILTSKRAFRDEARNYRRMLKRLVHPDTPERKATHLLLWRGLGEIYRTRLQDFEAAGAAFEVCSSLDPGNPGYTEILAEIFELAGGAAIPRAIEQRTLLFARAVGVEDMTRHLRDIRKLAYSEGQYDRVFNLCAALSALGQATPKEAAFVSSHASPGLLLPRGALTEEAWQRAVTSPAVDRRISQVLAAVTPAVATVRGKEPKHWGLREQDRLDPEASDDLIAQVVSYASRLLGIGRPALYIRPDVSGDIDMAPVLEKHALAPSFVVGGDMVRRNEKEMGFLAGRALALTRIEHLALWPHVVATTAELEAIVLAALGLFHSATTPPPESAVAFQKYVALFGKTLGPQALEQLSIVGPALVAAGRLDLGAWRTAVERTAQRAGLLCCGDLDVALRLVRLGASDAGRAQDDALDLLRWSVSEHHLRLRAELGLGIAMQTLGHAPAGDYAQ